jgi:hypothetical protein
MSRIQVLIVLGIVIVFAVAGTAFANLSRRVTQGKWSGNHVNLIVSTTGFELEFDCATGSAKGPATLDRSGKFKLFGNYVIQSGSPSAPRESRPAAYSGSVKGESMTLEVSFTDTNQSVGTYQLGVGPHQRLNKCPVGRPPDRNPPPGPN